MYLKKLQLQGFKTFAERTEISFSQGVTAIVGPNGSGKSNIADAILWVLGEQKASAVRGSKSVDVIFSGSDTRRQSGMAEVSLTVDNSDHTLPLDFNEVTITRRAYRAGDPEYFMNKVPCRLKDIYELFLDTGVGREAYSLVNQSEIDAVLSVNPEDRRGLFEEAAGIKKYRVKKREALRKLDATESNLQRVQDILHEIDGRIEPLKLQAERAERFIGFRDRLRAIESTLLIIDFRTVSSELTAALQQRGRDALRASEYQAALQSIEIEAQTISHELQSADNALEFARQQYQTALSHAERAKSQKALAAQRVESLANTLRSFEVEQTEMIKRRTDLMHQVGTLEVELIDLRKFEIEAQAIVKNCQAALDAVLAQVTQLSRETEKGRAQSLALARQQSTRQSDLLRSEARVAEANNSLPALRTEFERLEIAVTDESARLETAEHETDQLREQLIRAETDAHNAQAERERARLAVHEAQKSVNAVASRRVSIATRLRTLQDLESAQEGYFGGVKAVFDAVRRGNLRGDFTVIADCFSSPHGYETALETALGGSLQDIVTSTEMEAKEAIRFLHETKAGRATFLPLNRLRPSRDSLDLGKAVTMSGVCGRAIDIITFDEHYRGALEILLGRVMICETLDDAILATPMARYWSRAVTLAGEIVLPSGALTGGRQAGRGVGQLLGRKTEITELETDLRKIERETEHSGQLTDKAERERDSADVSLSESLAARQSLQLAVADARRRTDVARAEVRRLDEARGHAERRIRQAERQLNDAMALLANASAALESGGEETAGMDSALEQDSDRLRELSGQRDQITSDLTSARIALATHSERLVNAERALRSTRQDADNAVVQESRKADGHRDAQREFDTLVSETTRRDDESAGAIDHQQTRQRELNDAGMVRQELLARSSDVSQKLKQLQEDRAGTLDAIHRNEVKEARLEVQRNQVRARLQEEYEISSEDALGLAEDPEMEDGSPQEVNRLRRELRQMGEVNTGAIEEYAEVSTRHEFLTSQRAELDEARAKLLVGIKEIDDSTRGVFMETFNAVGLAFEKIFTRLFGGGKTDLVLTNPDDLLETGIDIIVQPPGKKRQNLALLSGGERAMTATALLFAFLDVKPSPFVVMDEVDAPLDGANVERFADLLREFGKRSQFIIITHNPTTMEAAPIWYGVAMQEAGTSRVLSMQVPQSAAVTDEIQVSASLT